MSLSSIAPTPAHVPTHLVYDFDLFSDPALLSNPHQRISNLIDTAPEIFWTPRRGGCWILLSHAANFVAARDVAAFSNEIIPHKQITLMLAQMPAGSPHIPQPYPIALDPPAHTKYRMPLQRVFSPKTIDGLKSSIRELAGSLIDGICSQKRCEFMSAVAEPLPVIVFLKMLGLPLERMPEYRDLVKQHLNDIGGDPSEAMIRLLKVTAIMRDIILDRRDHPKDDIFSMLWKVEIDGKPTTLEDIENFAVLLFIAGLDTVMNGIGLGVRHLAIDPALQHRLREQPSLIGEATEEMLRRYTFTVPPRRVKRDITFRGVEMKKKRHGHAVSACGRSRSSGVLARRSLQS